MVNTVIHAFFHLLRLDSHPFIVGHNSSGASLKGVHLALRVTGRGILVAAPVIENLGNMEYSLCRFRTAENKIIILGAVKLLAEPSHLLQQILPYNKQMAYIVDTGQQVRVEIRFEMGVKQRLPIHIQLILIRINDLTVRILIDCLYHLIKSIGRKGIVMVGQDNKVSPGHIQGGIGVA